MKKGNCVFLSFQPVFFVPSPKKELRAMRTGVSSVLSLGVFRMKGEVTVVAKRIKAK